ncbi:MAG: cadherin-like beta sandwich domain-containing protein [Bacilli bacterium]|nr:cadherin-like beta sandwich domain-containing protein [Bacilli bacterium]
MKRFKSLFFIMLLTLILVPVKVFAASDVEFKVGGADVKEGQEFTVDVSISKASAQNTLHGYSITVKFDKNIIEYKEAPNSNGTVSPGDGQVTISSKSQISSDITVATLKFKGIKAGNSTLQISNSCNINGEDTTCKASNGNAKVNALGTDASLSKLSIPNTPLSPAFNKNVRDYTANVKDVTQLTVNATATDGYASIQISDNRNNLQKGENTIKIVCTSENGKNETTYTIKVNLELTPTEEELKLMNTKLTELKIKGQKIDFNVEEVKYYLDVTYDVKSLEITATPENEAAQVQITGADKLVVGKNTVNILVTAEDGTTTKTYSILVTRLAENKKIVPTCPDTTSVKEWIIFSVGLFLTFTLGIVLGYILGKKDVLSKIFKKKEVAEEAVEIQTLSDTIDLSDVVEEIKDENV